ncbi:hypothetical protein AX766_01345 [Flavobacterium covae]|uniref:HEAT repeat domain-containing protein n=1 Tax=Flavobacterium covae TaxID=2906076 RepID=A0ABW8PJ54_9FLAO|nr:MULTISPECIES: hypothetical protein [Flavobacterium]AND63164.1 hypothetical protein AX766_01345 [Flavobacterium covae]OWP80207.1 hypothetical protein BWK63_12200 [Flavobacterium covae]POR20275.1 hypothetical protein BWK57_13310 [Flavobacterium columnare]
MENTLLENENIIVDEAIDLSLNFDKILNDSKSFNNQIDLFTSVNDTNYIISENEIMENRLIYLKKEITPLFVSLLKYEDFEFGKKSESIKIIQKELKTNRVATINWLNELYVKYFSKDEKVLIGILRVLEYFNEKVFYPNSYTIALSSLVHKNDEIKEIAIRIFENWASITSYEVLKNVQIETPWLKSYISEVLKDLEEELCLS